VSELWRLPGQLHAAYALAVPEGRGERVVMQTSGEGEVRSPAATVPPSKSARVLAGLRSS
jgi:hypothetical protein